MQAEFDKTDLIFMTVSSLLYFIFLLGAWMIYSEKVRSCIAKIRMRNRLKARKKAMRPEAALEKHLRKVLSTSMKKPMEPKVFLRYSALSFLLVLLAGLRTVNPISSLLMAALISSMPYLLLRVRVETIRRKSSYEGEKLISEFLCQYRMSGLNIYKTIEQVRRDKDHRKAFV